ncbi:MAG TPA: diacylglycerol kinase family protein [Wenzhouxiangella sp.]
MPALTFIINPVSGHPWSLQKRRILKALRGCPPEHAEILETENATQARVWAKQRADDPNHVVVAVGGDGTVHEVASALVGAKASLGILPVGSGNDFASMLTHPFDHTEYSSQAFIAYFQGAPRACVDVGQISLKEASGATHQHVFVNSMGLGIEGAVAGTVQQLRSIKGVMRYLLAALWQVFRYRPIEMRLSEGETRPRLLVSIGNGRRAGGGFLLQPDADIQDGQLDACWADDLSLWQQIKILPTVFWGGHTQFEGIHQTQFGQMTVHAIPGTAVHVDGEWVSSHATEINIQILPRALKVVGMSEV